MDFEYTFTSISSQDIERFERENNILLPEDYKQFLLSKNGGKTVKRRFKTEDEKVTSSIMLFFPLSEKTEANLEENYRKYNISKIVPSRFLPFGSDPAESLICLSLSGADKGNVYYCNMDYFEEDNELRDEYISLVARSFKGFMEGLYLPEK